MTLFEFPTTSNVSSNSIVLYKKPEIIPKCRSETAALKRPKIPKLYNPNPNPLWEQCPYDTGNGHDVIKIINIYATLKNLILSDVNKSKPFVVSV